MDTEDPIKRIVDEAIKDTEFKLVELDVRSAHGKRTIRVFLDSEQGITIEECRGFNRTIETAIDAGNFFTEYALEVSSPGVERPIQFDWQFRKNIGRSLKITFTEDNDTPTEFTGTIERVDSDMIYLKKTAKKKNTGEALCIPISKITRAQIQLKW